jgi:hypothetical protein
MAKVGCRGRGRGGGGAVSERGPGCAGVGGQRGGPGGFPRDTHCMVAVAKVEAADIHARLNELNQLFNIPARGAHGAHNLRRGVKERERGWVWRGEKGGAWGVLFFTTRDLLCEATPTLVLRWEGSVALRTFSSVIPFPLNAIAILADLQFSLYIKKKKKKKKKNLNLKSTLS